MISVALLGTTWDNEDGYYVLVRGLSNGSLFVRLRPQELALCSHSVNRQFSWVGPTRQAKRCFLPGGAKKQRRWFLGGPQTPEGVAEPTKHKPDVPPGICGQRHCVEER